MSEVSAISVPVVFIVLIAYVYIVGYFRTYVPIWRTYMLCNIAEWKRSDSIRLRSSHFPSPGGPSRTDQLICMNASLSFNIKVVVSTMLVAPCCALCT